MTGRKFEFPNCVRVVERRRMCNGIIGRVRTRILPEEGAVIEYSGVKLAFPKKDCLRKFRQLNNLVL